MGYARGYTDGMATPGRHVRIDDELWSDVKKQCDDENTDASSVIRELLTWWVYVRPTQAPAESPFE